MYVRQETNKTELQCTHTQQTEKKILVRVNESVKTNHHNKTSHWQAKAHMQVESTVPRETMMIQVITKVIV